MPIHLSKEHEQFVHNAVLTGRYASEDDVIRDALSRLKQDMPKGT
jgi:putative addiction module CopG family antidote